MDISYENVWLWVSGALLLLTLATSLYSAIGRGVLAGAVSFIAIPTHVALVIALHLAGAELTVALTCLMLCLLTYIAARYIVRVRDERKRGTEDDL